MLPLVIDLCFNIHFENLNLFEKMFLVSHFKVHWNNEEVMSLHSKSNSATQTLK